jgi:cbb3-type cytochrome oxidase subunit 1
MLVNIELKSFNYVHITNKGDRIEMIFSLTIFSLQSSIYLTTHFFNTYILIIRVLHLLNTKVYVLIHSLIRHSYAERQFNPDAVLQKNFGEPFYYI